MLRLGSDVVATTTGRVQQHAATVILETARCASGTVSAGTAATVGADGVPVCTTADNDRELGCATAALEEVNVLLDGLQSESVALREVSIQVSDIDCHDDKVISVNDDDDGGGGIDAAAAAVRLTFCLNFH